jgi:hypothetical protein
MVDSFLFSLISVEESLPLLNKPVLCLTKPDLINNNPDWIV